MTQIEASTASDNSTIRRLALRIDRQMLLTATLLFTLSAALFAFVQFGTPNLADNDGFYHMRMGALIREQGLRVSFPWLPLTILGPNAFYDHHLLFHVYLSLFGGNGSEAALLLGAKIASVIMPALACMAIWWLLRGQRVRRAALWSIGLFAVSQAFLYRMSMPRAQRLIPIGLAAILIVPLAITLTQARDAMIDQSQPADTYAAASHWLKDNTPPGSLIFQTDWDDFPRLFFYNTANVYTVGLDPTYMQLYDAALYDEWVKITQGKVDRPSGEIRSRFGGAYVLTDLTHDAFLNRAKADPGLKEVYRDQYAIVFAVVN